MLPSTRQRATLVALRGAPRRQACDRRSNRDVRLRCSVRSHRGDWRAALAPLRAGRRSRSTAASTAAWLHATMLRRPRLRSAAASAGPGVFGMGRMDHRQVRQHRDELAMRDWQAHRFGVDAIRQGSGETVGWVFAKADVRFGSKADILRCENYVCFTPKSGHSRGGSLPARSGNKAPDLCPAFGVLYGHTTASPNLFGAVTSASGGTSIHWLSSRTRYWPSFVSQSTSSTLWPSAAEQQSPLRLPRLSNHRLSGEFAYFPSRSRGKANPGKNNNDNAAQQIMPR